MCGIFGYATEKVVKNLDKVALLLAWQNEERGRASWGITDGKTIIKDVDSVTQALYRIPFGTSGTLVGHTRAATVGSVSKDNAHPWRFNGKHTVIGVHNGAIRNHDELNKKFNRKLEVDSQHIFKHLAEEKDLADLSGYGAIVFFQDGRLFLSRFNNGSLSIFHLKGGGIVFSSLESHLKKALEAFDIEYSVYNVHENKIYYYSNGNLYNVEEKIRIKDMTTHVPIRDLRHHGSACGTGNGTLSYNERQQREKKALACKVLIKIIPDPVSGVADVAARAAEGEIIDVTPITQTTVEPVEPATGVPVGAESSTK